MSSNETAKSVCILFSLYRTYTTIRKIKLYRYILYVCKEHHNTEVYYRGSFLHMYCIVLSTVGLIK